MRFKPRPEDVLQELGYLSRMSTTMLSSRHILVSLHVVLANKLDPNTISVFERLELVTWATRLIFHQLSVLQMELKHPKWMECAPFEVTTRRPSTIL
jgi:hypothetical protein